jgi:two-component system sensor histidine kinase KdpD
VQLPWRLVRAHWLGYGAAVGAVALVSGFIGLVLRQVNLANASMLYLLAVLATAVAFGRGPAVFASVVAFLTFDWFFVEPIHHLSVSDPGEWVSLLLFLMTAIVTGQLAAGQRQRAREAQQREREAVVLYSTLLVLAVERDRLRQEANQAEILRRTDELRRALLNAVSHDLRTPLASIMASASSLQQDDVVWTQQERQDFAQAIVDQAQRLNRIVDNLLDMSRIEGGSLRPDKRWYDMAALVDEVLGRLRPLTAQHRVVAHVPDDLPAVALDYVEIDQVLSNLIENATKYAPPATEIQVAVERTNGEVRVAIDDRGPGVPRSAVPHLFDPFYRVAAGTPRPAGLGLGLAVAKGLVEAHGGRIWVENRPGGGARFAFTLPLTDEE